MLITFTRTYLCKFFRCLEKLQSFQNKPFVLKPWDDLTNLPRRELISFLSTKQGTANMDLYPQPGLLKSQIAALTRPRCTPSGFTITYVLSEPPCIQCHLSKQVLHIGRWICEDGQYNAAEIKTDTDDESKWHVRIACLFVFEATASLLQMDIIPIITAMGNVIMATVTKRYTKPS
jgi:hypothetical protein